MTTVCLSTIKSRRDAPDWFILDDDGSIPVPEWNPSPDPHLSLVIEAGEDADTIKLREFFGHGLGTGSIAFRAWTMTRDTGRAFRHHQEVDPHCSCSACIDALEQAQSTIVDEERE